MENHQFKGDTVYCDICGSFRSNHHRSSTPWAYWWILPAFMIGLFLFIELVKHMYT